MRVKPNVILAFTIALLSVLITTAEEEKHGYKAWPMWALILFLLVNLILGAMYCGLTIGLLGLDTINLEIIAEAGPYPDNVYAEKIIPIRKLGHHLLVTLVLGNMLTMTLISQLVAAVVDGGDLVNFIVGTLVVLIFAEILPMAICNNPKYALAIGAKSAPILKASIVVFYVVAKPLGMLLDYFVKHEAGQLYDRNEFRKLIRVHWEKYSEKSGLDAMQTKMILNALDINEATVGEVMTPMDKTFMLDADAVLDRQLERRLWEFGKSRVPVYSGGRSNIIGVLYVRDLICVSVMYREMTQTVREFLKENPRDIYVVKKSVKLQESLRFFQNYRTQIVFVEEEDEKEKEKEKEGETTKSPDENVSSPTRIPAESLISCDKPSRFDFLGILTLEDIIEELLSEEIYDEDEHVAFNEDSNSEEDAVHGKVDRPPKALPRVNFYSYGVEAGETKDSLSPITDDQKWVLANYISRTFVYFASWKLKEIKFLIDNVGETVVWKDDDKDTQQLYRMGEITSVFTLVLGGSVKLEVGRERLQTVVHSFTPLAEGALLMDKPFRPDFSACVVETTRCIRFTREDVKNAKAKIKDAQTKRAYW